MTGTTEGFFFAMHVIQVTYFSRAVFLRTFEFNFFCLKLPATA